VTYLEAVREFARRRRRPRQSFSSLMEEITGDAKNQAVWDKIAERASMSADNDWLEAGKWLNSFRTKEQLVDALLAKVTP